MKSVLLASSFIALSFALAPVHAADEMKVKITGSLSSVTVKHNGKDVVIQRNQNVENTVNPAFAKTSRECPPFCVNPMQFAAGEEIIVAKAGKPMAKLVSAAKPARRLEPGGWKGRVRIRRGFDAPLPASLREAFEARR